MTRAVLLSLVAVPLLLGGCGDSANNVPGHTDVEQKAIDAQAKLTPEQRIAQIQNSPLPEGAKKDMIDRVKAESGIK